MSTARSSTRDSSNSPNYSPQASEGTNRRDKTAVDNTSNSSKEASLERIEAEAGEGAVEVDQMVVSVRENRTETNAHLQHTIDSKGPRPANRGRRNSTSFQVRPTSLV